MMVSRVALFLATLCLLLAPAKDIRAQGTPIAVPPAGAPPSAITTPMTLSEAQLNGFFGAMEDFKKMGAARTADPSKPAAFAQALRASAESEAVVREHGFADVTQFQRVGFNAAMAYEVLKGGGKDVTAQKLAKAKAEQAAAMDKVRQHLTPEQMKMLAGQLEGAMAQADTMQDVPPANLELIKKYEDRMEQLEKR